MPCDVYPNGATKVSLIGTDSITFDTVPPIIPTDAFSFYTNAPNWQKRIWGKTDISRQTLNIIIMHLLNDNIVAAGDGSVSNDKASHAWCIARKNDYSVILEGVGPTDGHPD